jgi:hypothetical protein
MKHNELPTAYVPIFVSFCIGVVAIFCNINIWNELDLDEFYNAINVRDYKNSPLGLLSFYEGHIFQLLFGDSLLNLRFLAQTNVLATVLIGVGYYWYCTRDSIFTSILLLICMVSAPVCFEIIFDWNTASFPFVILNLIMLLEYLKGRTGIKSVVVLGIVQALMVETRLPLMVVVPITIVLFQITPNTSKKEALKNTVIYFASGAVTTLVLYFVILGSPSNWLDAWSSKNIITGHRDIIVYFRNLMCIKWNLPQAGSLLVALLVSPYILQIKSVKVRKIVFALSALFLIGYDLVAWERGVDRPFNGYYYFAVIVLFIVAYYFNQKNRAKVVEITVIVLSALLPAIGSDVMVLRPIWLFVLPILLVYLVAVRRSLLIWLLLSGCVVIESFCYTTYRLRSRSNETLDIAGIEVMKQTHDHAKWVKDMVGDISANVPDLSKAVIVGSGKYLIDYLLTDGVGYHKDFFHYINYNGTECVDPLMFESMATKEYIILSIVKRYTVDTYSVNQDAIKSAGFEEILSKPTYIIYRRASKYAPTVRACR